MAKNKNRGGGGGGGGGDGGGGGGNQEEHGVGDNTEEEVKDGGDKKPEEGGGGGGGGEKKKDGPSTVVLKVDMHCNGCTKKIRDSIRGFPGVEGVTMDVAGGKMTVLGKVDPAKLRDRVASKAHKTVQIVSSATKKQPEDKGGGEKPDGNNKSPVAGTVVLKVRLHCHGCIQKMRKLILKVKGAEQVSFDEEKDLVTVKGTMDPKVLSEVIKKKMKRDSEVVQPKKGGDGGGEKKGGGGSEKKGGGGSEKKGGGGEQKGGGGEQKGGGGGGGGGNPPKPPEPVPVNLSNVWTVNHGFGPGVYAPQMFSDENPNACSVM